VLRFTGNQVREQMEAYCVPAIEAAVDRLGGYGMPEIYPPIDLVPSENWAWFKNLIFGPKTPLQIGVDLKL
jgi:hypothetical protein